MAIDTADKQMSMLNMVCGLSFNALPIPDGAYDSADLLHLLGLYRGIAAAVAATLNLRVALGSSVLVASGDVSPPSGGSDVPWAIECEFIVRSVAGVTALLVATGSFDNGESSDLLANTGSVSVDPTAAHTLQPTVQWGTADAANIATVQNLSIEKVGPV